MSKKELKDYVYDRIEKFVCVIDTNFDPSAIDARANAIHALTNLYKILDDEIETEK